MDCNFNAAFLKGQIYAFRTLSEAIISSDTKCIVVSEDIDIPQDDDSIITGTILLPPPSAKIAEIDGDVEKFNFIYYQHLNSKEVSEYLAAIIYFLHNGGNISMVIISDFTDYWFNVLWQHILSNYGIMIGMVSDGTPSYPFSFNTNYINILNNELMIGSFLDPIEYLFWCSEEKIQDDILIMLDQVLQASKGTSIEEINSTYVSIAKTLKSNTNPNLKSVSAVKFNRRF